MADSKKTISTIKLIFISTILSVSSISCSSSEQVTPPNIILIMADDMGYECLGTYGNTVYNTPVLDELGKNGIKFNACVSQPLCTPSRVKIMTGLYNYRNYEYFGHLNTDEYTFGNLMRDAGYATCIAGKWQLNGLAFKEEVGDSQDNTKPNKLGFDEYCLWQLTHPNKNNGGRYADPFIEQNGKFLDRDKNAYGPDIFADYIIDFLERKKDKPFFVYYPMVLVHSPFVPTPDSDVWKEEELRNEKDTAYFKDMVEYTDKIVGRITDKLKALKIEDNTIVIFTGDNGTHFTIYTNMEEGVIKGAKGNTIDHGTHVPLVISWPEKIKKGFVYDGLIEFSDFYATFAQIVNSEVQSDGNSFYPLLTNGKTEDRSHAFVHYDPRWSKRVDQYRNQFVRDLDYKLYQDGKFYDLKNDVMEVSPLVIDSLSSIERASFLSLKSEMAKHPKFK